MGGKSPYGVTNRRHRRRRPAVRVRSEPPPQISLTCANGRRRHVPSSREARITPCGTSGRSVCALANARGIVRQLDGEAVLFYIAPMESIVATTVARPRMYKSCWSRCSRRGPRAGAPGRLQRDGVFGRATHARNRHPHVARRRAEQRRGPRAGAEPVVTAARASCWDPSALFALSGVLEAFCSACRRSIWRHLRRRLPCLP